MNKRFHSISTASFHLFSNVTVNIKRKRRCGMSEIPLHSLDVISTFDSSDSVRVPLRYNNDKPEKPRNFKGLEVYQADFSSFSNPKNQATKPLFRRGC